MKEIASALVKAQTQFGPALKTSKNPHFGKNYANLAACVEAVIDGLNNNGIMLMQMTHECDNGVLVETVFIHQSGETLSAGKLHVPAVKIDAQGYGSALTYARRYSLMTACGIAPEDDDGNAATRKTQQDTYKAFEESFLPALRAAAIEGVKALETAFKDLPKNDDAKTLWATHGKSLKDAAKQADEKGAKND